MSIDHERLLVESLQLADAYPHEVNSEIQLIETHISRVFLAGDFAYKIKKPIQNSFLDYSTLENRKRFCEEELRLNQRFAKELYLDVVAITSSNGRARIGGSGEPIEYAVQMRRFAADALLSHRVAHNLVHVNDVRSLAASIADFHAQAAIADPLSRFGTPDLIYAEAIENCRDIAKSKITRTLEIVELLEHWMGRYFSEHQKQFELRKQNGHVRECHGDLHLGNVALWSGKLLPFDGIEFCEDFRWIDTLSDAAFTAMDLAASGRMDFCHSFVNAYFESTGDYPAVGLLQWYLVYRAMVRAKVAAMRSTQISPTTPEHATAENDLDAMLDLANRFTHWHSSKPQLWITYGLSGSGKTTGSEHVLQRHGAIRIRADIERKRLAGLHPLNRVSDCDEAVARLYSSEMTTATYHRLAELAEQLLRCNVYAVVDATCLLKWQREIFRNLAHRLQIPYRILAFHADPHTLRHRISQRKSENNDASDADLKVLDSQLKIQQHLEADEMQFIGSITEN
jgi:aminoglycoside phosphotransferase family enzyme/predicted kinase